MTIEKDGAAAGASPEDRLDELAESFVESLRRGESPEVEDYAREHPEIAEKIRKIFPTLRYLEKAQEKEPADSTAE